MNIEKNIYNIKAKRILRKYEKALKNNDYREAYNFIVGFNKYWGDCLNDLSSRYRFKLTNKNTDQSLIQ